VLFVYYFPFAVISVVALASFLCRIGDFASFLFNTAAHGSVGILPFHPHRIQGNVDEGTHDLFYLLPAGKAKAILIFFHGCQHSGGQDLFLLPEDRIVVHEAFHRNWVVVGLTSLDRSSGCWQPHVDVEASQSMIGKFYDEVLRQPRDSLPHVGMGASSGGAFVFHVHKALHLRAIASYISPHTYPSLEQRPESATNASPVRQLPPVAYVYMTRDARTTTMIETVFVPALRAENVDVLTLPIGSHPFNVERCMQRIPESVLFSSPDATLTQQPGPLCQQIVETAMSQKLLDGETFELLHDPGRPPASQQWEKILQSLRLFNNSVEDPYFTARVGRSFASAEWISGTIREELAVCYGRHEMTAEGIHAVLDFLEKHAAQS
jgi:hypothetical protein